MFPNAAEEIRVEASRVLKHACDQKPNITGEEVRALRDSKQDKGYVHN